jgi:hypothetical protein
MFCFFKCLKDWLMGSSGPALHSSGLTSYAVPDGKLTAVPAANALTIAIMRADGTAPSRIAPLYTAFRSDPTSGALYEGRTIIAAPSLVLSSGSTLGVASGTPFVIWILLFDDTDLPLGAVVCTTATKRFALDEANLLSSTAEGGAGAADSAAVVYTTVAVSSKPYRIIGKLTFDAGLSVAGTWDVAPKIQMFSPGVKKPGEEVQSVSNYSGALFTNNPGTVIPTDDTIPTKTEGDEYFSTPINVTSPANLIDHDILINASTESVAIITAALFQDSQTPALSANLNVSEYLMPAPIVIRHSHVAGLVGTTTFKIRAGPNATPVAFGLNCEGGQFRLFGGVMQSGHRITEVAA